MDLFRYFNLKKVKEEEKEIINLLGKSYAHLWKDLLGKKIGEGFYAKVHEVVHKPTPKIKMRGKRMVVKIGMTHDFPIGFISLPRKYIGNILEWIFGSTIKVFHTRESIIKAYEEEYLLIKKYFSPSPSAPEKSNLREDLLNDLQNKNSKLYQRLFSFLKREDLISLATDVFERHRKDNFLKDEHLVIGHPPHMTQEEMDKLIQKGEEAPVTYYIFQERVEGDIVPLGEITAKDLVKRKELTARLLTFALLLEKMYQDTEKMIDTRPEHVWKNPLEWFQKTGNLLIERNKNEVYFIDTRWLWDSNVRFLGKNGLHLVERLGERSVCRAIKKYAGILAQERF